MSHVDGVCFQAYLSWFSQKYPQELHIIQLDNGRLHTWSDLEIPENIILIFQPPYSPQVNPIERLWKEIKKSLKWELFDNLEELRTKLSRMKARIDTLDDRFSNGMGFYYRSSIYRKHLSRFCCYVDRPWLFDRPLSIARDGRS